jgi:cell wall-associated NlpC family hydrolase
MSIAVHDLVENYRSWLHVKFLHQGRTRLGADCLGFIAAGANEVGSSLFLDNLPINYARNPQSLLLDSLEQLTRKIDLQPGALIAIKWPFTQVASHAAIYTGTSIIHSYEANREVIEHGYVQPWIARTDSVWAIPLVKYL